MFTLSRHASKVIADKGFSQESVFQAIRAGVVTDVRHNPGQKRYARGDLAVIADPTAGRIITVYRNVVETDQRPDQTDDRAAEHFAARASRADRDRKRRERQARDRAFTAAQKNKKG